MYDNYIQDRAFLMHLTPEQQAADPNTSPEQLRMLVNQSIEILKLVAQNPNTSSEVLREIAKITSITFGGSNSFKVILEAVASNPNTPTDELLILGMDFPAQLLNNPVFPLLILENPNLLEQMPYMTQLCLYEYWETPEKLRNRLKELIDDEF